VQHLGTEDVRDACCLYLFPIAEVHETTRNYSLQVEKYRNDSIATAYTVFKECKRFLTRRD